MWKSVEEVPEEEPQISTPAENADVTDVDSSDDEVRDELTGQQRLF